jgi:hypothetical protein
MHDFDHGSSEYEGRVEIGAKCIELAAGPGEGGFDEMAEDRETYGGDAVSDILTALFGPAGHCVEGEESGPVKRVWNDEARREAEAFLDHCLRSWEGDSEDYYKE